MKRGTLRVFIVVITVYIIGGVFGVSGVSATTRTLTGPLPTEVYNNEDGGITITNASVAANNSVVVVASGGDIVLSGEVNIKPWSTFTVMFGEYHAYTGPTAMLTGMLLSNIYNNPNGGITITNASVEPFGTVLVVANGDIGMSGEVEIKPGSTFTALYGYYPNLTRTTDSDHNGLPDWWELVHYGQLGQNPNTDLTNSGISDYWRGKLNLDPTDPNSRPAPGTYYDYDAVGRIRGILRN